MAQTPEEYFSDVDNLGSYQWITLKEVLDQMLLEAQDDDSYIKNTKRSIMLMHAKQGIKILTKKASNERFGVEMTVGQDLFLPLPQDYVDYEMVCVITADKKLMPLNINRKINTAIGYLQDDNAAILFDNDGKILTSDSSNAYAFPHKKYEISGGFSGGYFETDTSQLSQWGEVNIDERRGTMVFSSNLMEREIVLIYESDGLQWEKLQDSEVTIHKHLEEALKNWIYFASIERKRNIPHIEKERARKRYITTCNEAILYRNNIDINEISKVLRVGSKML